MSSIREAVIKFMENTPTLSKHSGKTWYELEDALVEFACKLTGVKDRTYDIRSNNEDNLSKKLQETDYDDYEYKIYRKCDYHHKYEDLHDFLEENNHNLTPKEISLCREKASEIIEKYDDYLEYDWRTALTDAIDFVVRGETFIGETDDK